MSTTYHIRTLIQDFHGIHSEEDTNLISFPPRLYKNVGIDATAIALQGNSPYTQGAILSTDNQLLWHLGDINSLIYSNWYTYPLLYSATTAPLSLSLFNVVNYGCPLCYDSGTNSSTGFDITQWGNRGWGSDESTLKTRFCNYFESNKNSIPGYEDTNTLNLYFFKWKHSDTGYYYFPIFQRGSDSHADQIITI